jgi:hypothetical protein
MSGIDRLLLGLVTVSGLSLMGCGDGTQPARDPVHLQVSRDSVTLEIGDTVILRAEARDVNGDPIVNAAITWATLNAGAASLTPRGAAARVSAVSAGSVRITATAGALADTAVVSIPPALIATTLSTHRDTLDALGDTLVVHASSQDPTGTRLGLYSATVRNTAVAQVSVNGPDIVITATSPGQTYVTVVERHGTRDSVLAVVRQHEAILELTPAVAGGYVGWTQQLAAVVKDRRGNAIPGVAVTFRSFDTTIVTVSPTGVLTFLAPGSSAVEARGAGGSADTSTVTVPQTARLIFRERAESLGTGLLSETEWVGVDANGGVSPWATLTLMDTSIAQVPDSVLKAGGAFQIAGKKPGTTKLIASSLFMVPDTMTVFVSTSRLYFGEPDYPETRSRLLPLGSQGSFTMVALDSLGRRLDPAANVFVTIGSRDTTIVRLPQNDAPYLMRLQSQGDQLFPVVPVDTGRAWIVATANGFRSDSLLYVVTALPKVRFKEGRLHVIGVEQRSITGGAITTTRGWEHGGDVLVTFTRRHPEVATFPDTLTLPSNALYRPLAYIGLTQGVDTIIASASGYEPDTALLYVTTPHFIPVAPTIRSTTLGGYAGFNVGDSVGTIHATNHELLVHGTPADTTIARSGSGRVPAQWYAPWGFTLPAVDTGATTVTLTDSAGLYAPTSYLLRIDLDTSLQISVNDAYQYGPPAPRQRFEATRLFLRVPSYPAVDRVVYFSTTTPDVVRVPDSMVAQSEYFNYVPVAAGDVTGSTRVIVSAPGFRTDTSAVVSVVPGQLRFIAPDSAYVGQSGAGIRVSTGGWLGGCFTGMPFDTAATFTLLPLDAGVVTDTAATVTAGQICTSIVPVLFTTPGQKRLAVQDHRDVPWRYDGDTVTVNAVLPRLSFQYPYPPTVGVGQRLVIPIWRTGNLQDEITLALTHSSGRTATSGSLQMLTSQLQAVQLVDGLSIGRDTLIIAAPGYSGDTLPVIVTDGTVALSNWPSQLRLGDSIGIALVVRDSIGFQHPVTSATTFTLVKTGGIAFTDGAQGISTVTVPAGEESSPPFFVKAVGPTGSASVRFVNLYYTDKLFSVTVVP